MRITYTKIATFSILFHLASLISTKPADAEFYFNDCSATQKNAVLDAYSHAFSRIKDAEEYVHDNEIYRRWFGEWTKERAADVAAKIFAMTSAALIGTPEFTCLENVKKPHSKDSICTDETLAFFYTREEYHVYLCSGFWSIDPNHPDLDLTGVLIHELSHLNFDATTTDHCYAFKDHQKCIDKALQDPEVAINNADNYRMFVHEVGLLLLGH